MLERLARFVFRHRDLLFPALVAAILLWRPPAPLGDRAGDALWIVGVVLIGLGQALRAITIGLRYIKRGGRDGRFFAPELVVSGIFAHCRNPMYVGNLLIATGLFVAAGDLIGIAVGAGVFIALYATLVHGEEQYLAGRFGEDYAAYCRTSPRWFVRLRGLRATLGAPFDWRRLLNKEYGTLFISFMAPAGLLAWKIVRAEGVAGLAAYALPFALYAAIVLIAYVVVRVLKKQRRLDPPRDESVAHTLAVARAQINRIDDDLLRLFNARAREVRRVYDVKSENRIPRFDSARTEQILARIRASNPGPLRDDEIDRLFRSVLNTFLGMDMTDPAAARTSGSVSIEPAAG
ncbi:MAG: chorismate mutase [Phycisphaerales bacterium]|nr:chorismate mutase [Phycisphaerales bacterium]